MTKPLILAAKGEKTDRLPVWFLRQAGRYLPEYMEIRKNIAFTDLCKNPELASEVTLQPLRRFDVDAAIIFSDILVPCMPMGQELTMGKGHGPQLSNQVRSPESLKALRKPDAFKELSYVGDAIAKTKAGLKPHQTMIGFAGAPFTVASYMIEGCGSKTYTEVKKLRYQHPETFTGLLDLLVDTTIDYLSMQVEAGAETLMLFDTWAAEMNAYDYAAFVFPSVNKIIKEIKKLHDVPVIYFPGKGTDLYAELDGFAGDVIAVDWRVRLSSAVSKLSELGLDVSVQGNLDPQTFLASEEIVREHTRRVIEEGKKARGHIFNVGHGLLPHLNPDALNWAIDEIRKS